MAYIVGGLYSYGLVARSTMALPPLTTSLAYTTALNPSPNTLISNPKIDPKLLNPEPRILKPSSYLAEEA